MSVKKLSALMMIFALIASFIPGISFPERAHAAANFYDNFSSGNANNWTPIDGNWSVSNGQYQVNAGSGYKSIVTNSNYSSFAYEATVTVGSGGNAGLIFRVSNPTAGTDNLNGYYVGLDTLGQYVVIGREQYGWTSILSYPFTVNANQAYDLKVVAKGSAIDVYVNSAHVISIVDSTFTAGSVGLRTFNTTASFTNVSVTDYGVVQDPSYNWSGIKGAVYVPTNAVNAIEEWQSFDPVTTNRELYYAHVYGINTVRVFLPFVVWQENSQTFLNNIETFLQVASQNGIKTEFAFFDDVWNAYPQSGPQPGPIYGVHNSRWAQSPGNSIKDGYFSTYKAQLQQYVQGIVNAHLNDSRIAFWEIYNEPGNGQNSNYANDTNYIMNDARIWIKDTGTGLPVTATGGQFLGAPYSDFYSFHNYSSTYDGPYGPNVLMTEGMNRQSQSVPGIVQNYGGKQTGYIMWELGIGRDNCRFPWSNDMNNPATTEPAIPFHGIIYPDGHPFDVGDVTALNGSTSNMPVFNVDYFNGNFGWNPVKSSVTPLIDFDLNTEHGTAQPDASAGMPDTNWSVRWNGTIKAPSTGTYTFYVNSDNIAGIWIDGTQVVNKNSNGLFEASGTINLIGDLNYHIRVDYTHATGAASMHVNWSGPNLAKQVLKPVPASSAQRYKIVNRNSGKVLDVAGMSTAYQANVQQWTDLGNTGQEWMLEPSTTPGYFNIRNVNSGQVLDVNGGSTAPGGNVQQYPFNNCNCQNWKLISDNNGYFRIQNQNSGLMLDVNADSTSDGANVQQYTDDSCLCQEWELVPVGNVKLINVNSGMAVDVSQASTSNGGNIQQWTDNGCTCQSWSFVPNGNGYFRIVNQNSGLVMSIEGTIDANGQNIWQWQDQGHTDQQWRLEFNNEGYFTLRPLLDNNRAANVENSSTPAGANIYLYDVTGGMNQYFAAQNSGH